MTYPQRPARTSQAETPRGPARPNIIARLARAHGAELSIAVLESRGRTPLLSMLFARADGSVAVRLEFKDSDLDVLEEAIAACRSAARRPELYQFKRITKQPTSQEK